MFEKKIDVNWIPMGNGNISSLNNETRLISNALWFEPQPVMKHLVEQRDRNVLFLKCPAVSDLYKNTYVIKSPFNVKFICVGTPTGKSVRIIEKDPEFEVAFLNDRGSEENSVFKMMSLAVSYMFYAKQSVEMEIYPPMMSMHVSPTLRNINVVCGKFDISKWIRPTDFAFEIIDTSQVMEFRRGDPLFYVKFNTNKKVNLVRTELSQEVLDLVRTEVGIKKYIPGNSMEKNYELAKSWIDFNQDNLFKKKCPFGFGK